MKKKALVFLMMLLVMAAGVVCAAATPVSISVEVTVEQASARSMLEMINEFRTGSEAWYWNSDNTTKTECSGLGTLVYDYELEEKAIQRATEIALFFAHTRPNNTPWYTVFPMDCMMSGENLAGGQTSAYSAFVSLREDDYPYKGQGHRRNMLGTDFNCIGIGHVICNGIHYWTQELAYRAMPVTTLDGPEPDGYFGIGVDVAPELVNGVYAEDITLEVDQHINAPAVSFTMTETWGNRIPYLPYDLSLEPIWTISDPEKLVLSYYDIRGLNAGETTMTAEVFGMPVTANIRITPKDLTLATVTVSGEYEFYNALPHTPFVSVMYGETVLEENKDYTLSYANNINGGEAIVAVTGMGNYAGTAQKTFTIQKSPLTVTALDQTITYGDAPAPIGVEMAGFYGDDTEASLGGELAYSCSYEQYGGIGTYAITPYGLLSDNYEFNYIAGLLTVNVKEVGISWSDTTLTYNGQYQAPTATVTGLVNSDLITTNVAGPMIDAGSYIATAESLYGEQVNNYLLPEGISTAFTISKAAPELTAPEAVQGLVEKKTSQQLICPGDTNDGVMEYSLQKDQAYSKKIPTAKKAGTYTVWYRVVGDQNHEDTAPRSVTAEIRSATVTEVTVNGGIYTLNLKAKTATLKKAAKDSVKSLVIEDSVSANNTTYPVTAIGNGACKGMKKLTKVTIGKNVKKIGKNAFNGCKKLKTIVIQTKQLTAKNVGTDAFKNISSKPTVSCPAGKASSYGKILKKQGMPSKAKFVN